MTLASPAFEQRGRRRSLRALGAAGLALARLVYSSRQVRADQRPGIFRIGTRWQLRTMRPPHEGVSGAPKRAHALPRD